MTYYGIHPSRHIVYDIHPEKQHWIPSIIGSDSTVQIVQLIVDFYVSRLFFSPNIYVICFRFKKYVPLHDILFFNFFLYFPFTYPDGLHYLLQPIWIWLWRFNFYDSQLQLDFSLHDMFFFNYFLCCRFTYPNWLQYLLQPIRIWLWRFKFYDRKLQLDFSSCWSCCIGINCIPFNETSTTTTIVGWSFIHVISSWSLTSSNQLIPSTILAHVDAL